LEEEMTDTAMSTDERGAEAGAVTATHVPVRREVPVAETGPIVPVSRGPVGLGLVTMLLGAWGAVVAYGGPTYGYGPRGAHSWSWTTPHLVLNLIPGAVAFAAGLLTMLDRSITGAVSRFCGLLAFGAGAWFVLARTVYPIFYGTAAPDYGATGHGHLASFVTTLGYGLGVGVALCVLGGMIMAHGRIRGARRMATAAPVAGERVVDLRNTEPAAV
jgi:hypothetical protein